jgi:ParB family transcriptional regulator, chromosome partitioning protein
MAGLRRNKIKAINLDNIEPNPYQPRQNFNKEKIHELAQSISKRGLIQKITVISKMDEDFRPVKDRFYLISGERRFRAYKQLRDETGKMEYKAIEAIVVPTTEFTPESYKEKLMLDSLVENIDRSDLTIVEKAESVLKMQEETGRTYKEIGELIGKAEGTIKNWVYEYKSLSNEEKRKVKEKGLGLRKIKQIKENKSKSRNNKKTKKQIQLTLPYTRKQIQKMERKEQYHVLERLIQQVLEIKEKDLIKDFISDYITADIKYDDK